MSKALIVGTGRCGLVYCQGLLRICGVRCSHQKVFDWDAVERGSWDWGDSEAESSFMAVPMLDVIKEREPDTKIVMVHRNARFVIASWMRRGAFLDDMPQRYPQWHAILQRQFPAVMGPGTQFERARRYMLAWNKQSRRFCDVSFQIERMTPLDLFRAIDRESDYDEVLANALSKTTNSSVIGPDGRLLQ